jgi:hypothetical protein
MRKIRSAECLRINWVSLEVTEFYTGLAYSNSDSTNAKYSLGTGYIQSQTQQPDGMENMGLACW